MSDLLSETEKTEMVAAFKKHEEDLVVPTTAEAPVEGDDPEGGVSKVVKPPPGGSKRTRDYQAELKQRSDEVKRLKREIDLLKEGTPPAGGGSTQSLLVEAINRMTLDFGHKSITPAEPVADTSAVKDKMVKIGYGNWGAPQWPPASQISYFEGKRGVFVYADVRDRLFWPDSAACLTEDDDFNTKVVEPGPTIGEMAREYAKIAKKRPDATQN